MTQGSSVHGIIRATHSSVLAWRIPGTGEPGGPLSMRSHRVGHDWSDLAVAAAHLYKDLGREWSVIEIKILTSMGSPIIKVLNWASLSSYLTRLLSGFNGICKKAQRKVLINSRSSSRPLPATSHLSLPSLSPHPRQFDSRSYRGYTIRLVLRIVVVV